MALAAVLSAVRELILDSEELPVSIEQRQKLYQDRFPLLALVEIEDLAKIPPPQIRTYTSTIFAGEKGVLCGLFPATFALLTQAWPAYADEPFDAFIFTRKLHRARPWKSNTTISLAGNFVEYITVELAALGTEQPLIAQCALFELLCMKLKRAPDDVPLQSTPVTPEEFTPLSVSELMQLSFTVRGPVFFQAFSYDFAQHYQHYRRNSSFPSQMSEKISFLVGSRDQLNTLHWRRLSADIFNFLEACQPNTPQALLSFAEHYAESATPEQSEKDIFSGFLTLLVGLIQSRVLCTYQKE